jgi:predicted GIY-YIG superfamily endonuclease
MSKSNCWWVYVIQSQEKRRGARGRALPGFFYVGATTDPARRLRQHNGEIKGGGRYTAQHRPWLPAALFGPYGSQSEALRAERLLKRTKRGMARVHWSKEDSTLCWGLGPDDPWVLECDREGVLAAAAPSEERRR